jgi:hypothetical protein
MECQLVPFFKYELKTNLVLESFFGFSLPTSRRLAHKMSLTMHENLHKFLTTSDANIFVASTKSNGGQLGELSRLPSYPVKNDFSSVAGLTVSSSYSSRTSCFTNTTPPMPPAPWPPLLHIFTNWGKIYLHAPQAAL